jgi:hypothetical protein
MRTNRDILRVVAEATAAVAASVATVAVLMLPVISSLS